MTGSLNLKGSGMRVSTGYSTQGDQEARGMRMGQDEETNGLGWENIALYRKNKRNVTNPKTLTNSFDRLVVAAGICPLSGSGVAVDMEQGLNKRPGPDGRGF